MGFAETINLVISKLENDGIIGKTKLRTRIKTVKSALTNTEEKALDDIFGFELVTQNERDKEVLMLLIHNLFSEKYSRHKNHNKSNGYFAHHCTGIVKTKVPEMEVLELQKHILEAKTNELKEEYRDMPNKEQKKYKKSDIYGTKPRYPVLAQEIIENGQIDYNLQTGITKSLEFVEQYLKEKCIPRKSIPFCEVQFKTEDVEKEAKYGRAQHVKYKKVDEQNIKRRYFERKLSRGVDYPFIFVRNENGDLEIEHTSKTLISMWPFMKDTIESYKKKYSYPVANYDMYFAKVFPVLEPYVQRNLPNEPSLSTNNCDEEMAWAILRSKIINDGFVLPHSDYIKKVVGRN